MKRILVNFLLLIVVLVVSQAQDISRYEYWLDDNHSERYLVNSSDKDIAFNISTVSLSEGVHSLNFRAYRSDGVWGDFNRYLFYIASSSRSVGEITEYEYWIDNATNKVIGTDIKSDYDFNVDVSNLTNGKHIFCFRVKNTSGEWSNIYFEEFEIKNGVQPILPSLTISSNGNGTVTYNGTSVRNQSSSFSVDEGLDAVISFVPDDGYRIKSVEVNSYDVTSNVVNNTYTISSISDNTTVEVEFEAAPSPIVESFEVDGINYKIGEDNNASVTQRNNKYYGEVVIPSQVTYNGKNYNVTSIGINAFSGCSEMISVTIPNSVSDIAEGAFSGCSILEVYSYAETVPQTDVAAFHGTPTEKSTLFVPANAIEAYKTAWPWSDFKEIVAIGSTPDDNQTISGECGDNVNYTYNKTTHTLTISGKGTMWGYDPHDSEEAPWDSYITEIQSIIIEPGVTGIGSWAFGGCSNLTSVTIPNSVTSIGGWAFYGCIRLTSIFIPNSVTYIGMVAFPQGTGLTSVHITDLEAWCKIQFRSNPLEYAHHLYMNGKEIKDLVIPSSVTSISSKAFFGCSGLTSVTIPQSVTSIGEKAFTNCSGITSIIVENGNLTYDSRDNCNALIETANNTLIKGCVNSVIPYGVTSIGENAFSECANLTSIIIPNSVSSIGSYAFQNCTNLASVDIPNSVISVGSNVFEGTSWYDNQPDGLVYFGRVAYYYKGQIPANTNFTIREGTIEICNGAFYGQSGLISITIPNGVISIGGGSFYGCSLTSVIIPNSVETIGDNAFDHLSSVVLGKNVKSIGKNAFAPYYKGEPTTVISLIENPFPILGKSLGDIWSEFTFRTFDEATLYVPIGTIDKYKATDGWKDFVHIEEGTGGFEIPDDNMQIKGKCGENVYYSYDSATHTLTISGEGAISEYDLSGSPDNRPWRSYSEDIHHIIIESGVTSIGQLAFYCFSSLTSVTIPNSVTKIGGAAFLSCGSLTSITIPNSLMSIGKNAFGACSNLSSITLPNSVTEIGDAAFYGCSTLSSISLPHGLKQIGENLFWGCSNLTSVTIPKGVTSIGEEAFRECLALPSITIPNSVMEIGERAFESCTSLKEVISEIEEPFNIPENVFQNIASDAVLQVPQGTKTNYQLYDGWTKHFAKVKEIGELNTFQLTLSAVGSGSISYNDISVEGGTQTISIETGASVTVTFHPNDGYQIRSATVNGKEISDLSSMSFTIDVMDEDVTIEVEFETLNVDGIFYSIDTDQKTAMVIKVPLLEKGEKYEGNIIIPETIFYNGIEYSVMGIYDDAFAGCNDILTVSLPQSLTYIGIDAFWDCKNLVTVNIPSSIKRIFSLAFSGCNSLTNLYCYSEDVPQTADDAFYNTPIESVSLYVPESTIEKYKAAKPWSDFNRIVAIGSTPDDDSQFSGKCGENAYYNFEKAIHTLTISGEGAISGCNLLEDPDDRPWKSYLNDIQHINIESGITSLDYWAFYGCGCMSISIPNSVTTIKMVTFGNLDNLTDVYCYAENVPNTHESAFNGTHTESVTLHVPANAVKAYKTTLPWSEFKEIVAIETEPVYYEQFQDDGINYQVTESGEVEVISAEEGVKCVTIPSTVTHNSTLYKVTAITNDAFEKCEQMAAIIWNPSVMFNARVSNPNLLLYVKDKDFASIGVNNVIVNGTAESIELTDAASGNDFFCPKAFTAKKITYSHYYNMKTGLGDSKGWETIVLPFDVQKYTSPKGEIVPFTKWANSENKKPFWLFELTASGYKDVEGIKANTPYIISMPNNPQYLADYVINGIVTFSSENVEVKASDNMQSAKYQDRTFVPNYTNKAGDDCLALNVNNYYVTNPSTDIDGSKFIKGLRAIHPFEAYMTTTSNTRSIDVLDGMTTAIKEIMMTSEGIDIIKVYDTRGVLVKMCKTNNDLRNGLAAGVYIVNGKKMIIK